MNYPDSLTIKGYPYTVEYVATPQEVTTEFVAGAWLGICTDNVIRVLAVQEPFGILDTLLHEILHAIFARNPLLKAAIQSDDLEEPFVGTLAVELAKLLTENGWVTTPKKLPTITKRILE